MAPLLSLADFTAPNHAAELALARLSGVSRLVPLYARIGRDIVLRQDAQGWGAKVIARAGRARCWNSTSGAVCSRAQLAGAVNSALTPLYWQIGRRIRNEVLQGERAEYGEQIVATLARQLESECRRGFSAKNLRHMLRFADAFPDEAIVSAVSRQLSWTHLRSLIYIEDPLKRDFYLQMSQAERWSTRTLQGRLDSLLFERTALSRQPEELLATELAALRQTGALTPALILKDPYVLDFLGLHDRYLEKDLEDAILRELENFLLELGAGFTFVARQKRIQIDDDDFYIDLACAR